MQHQVAPLATTGVVIRLQEADGMDAAKDARACPLCGRIGSRGYDDVRHLNSQMHYKYRPLRCPLAPSVCIARELPSMRALLDHFHAHVASGEGEALRVAWREMQGGTRSIVTPRPEPVLAPYMTYRARSPVAARGMEYVSPAWREHYTKSSTHFHPPAPLPPHPDDVSTTSPTSDNTSSPRISLSPKHSTLLSLQNPSTLRDELTQEDPRENITSCVASANGRCAPRTSSYPHRRYSPYEDHTSHRPSCGSVASQEQCNSYGLPKHPWPIASVPVDSIPTEKFRLRPVWEGDWPSSDEENKERVH